MLYYKALPDDPAHQLSRPSSSHPKLTGYVVLATTTTTSSSTEIPPTHAPMQLPGDVSRGGGAAPQLGAWLLGRMRRVLPSHWTPDELVVVQSFPMTTHGKVDMSSLSSGTTTTAATTATATTAATPAAAATATTTATTTELTSARPYHVPHPQQQQQQQQDDPPSLSSDMHRLLTSAVCSVGGLASCPAHSKLLTLGLDSFDVARIANHVETTLLTSAGGRAGGRVKVPYDDDGGGSGGHVTELMGWLLENIIEEVAEYLAERLLSEGRSQQRQLEKRKPRRQDDDDGGLVSKRPKVMLHPEDSRGVVERSKVKVAGGVKVESWRKGQCFVNGR